MERREGRRDGKGGGKEIRTLWRKIPTKAVVDERNLNLQRGYA